MKLLKILLLTINLAATMPLGQPDAVATVDSTSLTPPPPPTTADTAATRGCGTTWYDKSDLSYPLKGEDVGNAHCQVLPAAVNRFIVGQGCSCYVFASADCNLNKWTFKGWVIGPSQRKFDGGNIKWYYCHAQY